MAKVKVPVLGTIGKAVAIEADAPSRAEVAASIAAAIAAIVTTGTPAQSAYPTLWRLIREIPPNIQGLASLASTGIMVRTGAGTFTTRSVAVADTARLTVANGSGVAGAPTLDMADISQRSVWARSAATDGKPAAVQSSGDKAVLHQSGTTLAFSGIDSTYVSDFNQAAQDAVGGILVDSSRIDFTYSSGGHTLTADIIANSIGDSQLRQGAGTSIIGRSANTTGNVADIVAGSDDTLLRRVGSALDFGQLTVGMFPNNLVTYAKIQDVSATSRILGRITAGSGDIEELTGTQATTLLNVFTSLLQGLVPASGGGTTNFLRADGTFAAPAASTTFANPSGLIGMTAANGVATTATRSDATHAIDSAIAPTWTGLHTFTAATTPLATLATGDALVKFDGTTRSRVSLGDTGAGSNEKYWRIASDGGVFSLDIEDDTRVGTSSAMTFTRSGTTLSAIALSAKTSINTGSNTALFASNNGAQLSDSSSYALSVRASGNGVRIHAGTGSSDNALVLTDAADVNNLFIVQGGGNAFFSDGSSGTAGIGFILDSDTGLYRIASNAFEATAGGTRAMQWNSTSVIPLLVMRTNTDGSATAPTYSSNNDTNTGTWFPGADQWAVTTGGVSRLIVGSTIATFSVPINTDAAATTAGGSSLTIGQGSATSASAGGASALPATPSGYLIWSRAGSTIKVPYYAN